jgi:hypothetical protein
MLLTRVSVLSEQSSLKITSNSSVTIRSEYHSFASLAVYSTRMLNSVYGRRLVPASSKVASYISPVAVSRLEKGSPSYELPTRSK